MSECRSYAAFGLMIGLFLLVTAARAASFCGPDALQASGSIYRICMPAPGEYNGNLVIWAHGFQDAGTPVSIPEEQMLIGNTSLPEIINGLGFGFATNSYSKTGLAVREGVDDILDLVELYAAEQGTPQHVYATGASEGGLITTLLVEGYPEIFSGGVGACGPIGDFPYQINYFGDARVVFEFFFPGLIPGDLFDPPQSLVDNWPTYYEQVVRPVVFDPANRDKLDQWVKVARLPFDDQDYLTTVEVSAHDVLNYAVVNSTDASATLGGFPYNNRSRLYLGSDNDFLLNLLVQRFDADPLAVAEMKKHYNTSGQLSVPLTTMHTRRDQQVPFFHQTLYTLKTLFSGSFLSEHIPIAIDRYEHCNFDAAEVLVAFALMLINSGGQIQTNQIADLLEDGQRTRFEALAAEYGLENPLTTR